MEATTDVRGTCLTMCPDKEIAMREREGLLSPFEVVSTEEDRKDRKMNKLRLRADRRKIVKQYSRPAAGRTTLDPSQLRPAPVLKDTVAYLFSSIVPKDNPAWTSVYEFVFDRLRAVRQDMVMQGIVGRDAIHLLEQMVRFHLFASYKLRDAEAADFDPVLNKQHLLECLKRLLYLYKVTPGYHPHREEFEGIYLLDNLGDSHALSHCLGLSKELRTSPLVQQCYEISKAFVLRNYSRALRLISGLPCPMCLCAVNPQLHNFRINYLQILSAGYSVKNCKYPVEKLRQQLALTSTTSVIDLCSKCGLVDLFDHPDPGNINFISFNKSAFKRPQVEEKPSTLVPLDAILEGTTVSLLLMGNASKPGHSNLPTTPEIDREEHQLITSLGQLSMDVTAKHEIPNSSQALDPRGNNQGEINKFDRSKSVDRPEISNSSQASGPRGNNQGEISRFDSSKSDETRKQEVQGSENSSEMSSDCLGIGKLTTPEGFGSKTDFIDCEENRRMKLISAQSNAASTPVSPLCSQRRGRGRGVRVTPREGDALSTPRRGRGRGRKKN